MALSTSTESAPSPSEKAPPLSADNLLTQDEAIRLLRLDALNLKSPKEALRHLRQAGQISYVKVSRKILSPRGSVEEYLRRHFVGAPSSPLD